MDRACHGFALTPSDDTGTQSPKVWEGQSILNCTVGQQTKAVHRVAFKFVVSKCINKCAENFCVKRFIRNKGI